MNLHDAPVKRPKPQPKKRQHLSTHQRQRVYQMAGGHCYLCGVFIDPSTVWHADHIKPLSAGGEDTISNLAPTHPSCNTLKGVQYLKRAQQVAPP